MPTQGFLLTTISKMHVGDDTDRHAEGIIDKLIQRDHATDLPYIASKSFRGALKERLKTLFDNPDYIKIIFGEESSKGRQGQIVFDDVFLASMPVRSDKVPYFNVSSVRILEHLKERYENYQFGNAANFGAFISPISKEIKNKKAIAKTESAILENKLLTTSVTGIDFAKIKQFYDSDFCLVNHDHNNAELLKLGYEIDLMKVLTDDNHLPIESHNFLVNGESKNLWYEQILLPKTLFYFFISYNDKIKGLKEVYEALETQLLKIQTPHFQIGSDASLGYGYVKIEKLNIFNQANHEPTATK